ncbi:hypothetical protein LX73_1389 [Fodinibius salinus]|uniref:Uncharacterized protein n=1 Tax=Fodinibius salinus TaxID=860790 RepID=A0A5D3YJQ5_9BACT|nr:hypothetical protein LX73_1389 [Fodinibius salinus]
MFKFKESKPFSPVIAALPDQDTGTSEDDDSTVES